MILDGKLVYAISLKSKKSSKDWDKVSKLLKNTLVSILSSTSRDFHIVVCGHEKPKIKEINDQKVTFLEATFDPPSKGGKGRPYDKMRKRRMIAAWVKDNISDRTRMVLLDADDLVHKDLTKVASSFDGDTSLIISSGYRLDVRSGDFEKIHFNFFKHCGSCFLPAFKKDELPDSWEDETKLFSEFGQHGLFEKKCKELGRGVENLPLAPIVYIMNHDESLEYSKKGRKVNLIKNNIQDIERKRILKEEFSFDPDTTFFNKLLSQSTRYSRYLYDFLRTKTGHHVR